MDEPEASTPAAPPPVRSSWTRWLIVAVFVGAIAAFYLSGLHEQLSFEKIRGQIASWQAQVEENLLAAVAVFLVAYVSATALSLPIATWLSLAAGALFGRWLGTGLVSVAATLGATLAFLSSRYVLRDFVQQRWGQRLEPINRGVTQDGAFYLFTLRLVPAVPFFLINLGMGLTTMRTLTFAVVSWIGMLPGTFLYVSAGRELSQIESPRGILSPGVIGSLALLGIVPLLLRKIVQRRSNN